MKGIIKMLRVIVVLLSFSTLTIYYIVTADIPSVVELYDLNRFVAMYLIVFFITIADFSMCIKHNYRGGCFALCFGILFLFLWVLSYNGVNFDIINNDESYIIKRILLGGVITSIMQILGQFMCLINAYVKIKKH